MQCTQFTPTEDLITSNTYCNLKTTHTLNAHLEYGCTSIVHCKSHFMVDILILHYTLYKSSQCLQKHCIASISSVKSLYCSSSSKTTHLSVVPAVMTILFPVNPVDVNPVKEQPYLTPIVSTSFL